MDAPDSPMTDGSSQSPQNSALLSPPGSQGADANRSMPVTIGTANANGKRPRNHISNGLDTEDDDSERPVRAVTSSTSAGPTSRAESKERSTTDFTPQVHEKSGYRWERPEDAPGYGWSNKKAQDEYNRVWDVVTHKELAIKGKYGDPIELAEQEAAYRASLQQS